MSTPASRLAPAPGSIQAPDRPASRPTRHNLPVLLGFIFSSALLWSPGGLVPHGQRQTNPEAAPVISQLRCLPPAASLPMTRPTPCRFAVGDHVFLLPRQHTWLQDSFLVMAIRLHHGWPHYALMAPDGSQWQSSQLELLSKPLPQRRS